MKYCLKSHCSFGYTVLTIILLNIIFCLYISCTPVKSSINRASMPELNASVPIGTSELLDVRHFEEKNHGHEDLYFSGQLYTKAISNGSPQLRPCSGCIVSLTTKLDTSTRIRMTTESDGYFEFHGKSASYSLSLNIPGFNPIVVEPLDLGIGGRNHIVLINAAGGSTERFSVSRNNKEFNWKKIE